MLARDAALFALGLFGGLCDGGLGVSETIVMVPGLLILEAGARMDLTGSQSS